MSVDTRIRVEKFGKLSKMEGRLNYDSHRVKFPSHCKMCDKDRFPRSHHCRVCRTCVYKMDHHCPFIMNCVGYYNHRYFMLFMIYTSLLSTFLISFTHRHLVKNLRNLWTLTSFDFVSTPLSVTSLVAFLTLVTLVPYASFQFYLISRGRTIIENNKMRKIKEALSVRDESYSSRSSKEL